MEMNYDTPSKNIRNMALYRLGVALLEIGFWKEFDSFDVTEIRQLADPKGTNRLRTVYPRYLEIAQRCLDCDFGYGTDLRKKSLQQSVYDKVINELDGMIAAMDISDD
jgi:hypothetical protein